MAFGATSPLRPHATVRINNYILNRKCVHVDAWMYWNERDNAFVVRVQLMLAARELITRNVYLVEPDERLVALGDVVVSDHWQRVTINGQWARSHPDAAAMLNRVHWRDVVPLIDKARTMYQRASVILHYVRAPSLDPCEGIDNMYDMSGRGERDERMRERHVASSRTSIQIGDRYGSFVVAGVDEGRMSSDGKAFKAKMAALQRMLD